MEVKSEKLKVKRGEVAGRLQIYRSEERVMRLLQRICNPLERSYRQIANLPKREKITNGAYLVYICIKRLYHGKTKYIVHKTK